MIWWVAGDPQVAHAFGLSDAEIDEIVNGAFEGYYSEFMPQNFGLQVWTNNSYLAAMCLASGVLVVPPLFMIWSEAVRFGVIGGVMVGAGQARISSASWRHTACWSSRRSSSPRESGCGWAGPGSTRDRC
jgi:uncharacterized membrane protein SpoIIM required for sporulation